MPLVLTRLPCRCSNDAYDAATGVDKTKKESVVNLTGGNATPVLAVAMACLAAGAVLLWRGIASAVRHSKFVGCACLHAVSMW